MNTGHSDDAELVAVLDRVDDPEYPGVSIRDLGMVHAVTRDADGVVRVSLVPTFGGCPALPMIASDVRHAYVASGVTSTTDEVTVEWLDSPVWSPDRISAAGSAALAAEFTVVLRDKDGSLRCPVCGSRTVRDRSAAGPTRCRSIAWCDDCRNAVEVMR